MVGGRISMVGTGCAKMFKKAKRSDLANTYRSDHSRDKKEICSHEDCKTDTVMALECAKYRGVISDEQIETVNKYIKEGNKVPIIRVYSTELIKPTPNREKIAYAYDLICKDNSLKMVPVKDIRNFPVLISYNRAEFSGFVVSSRIIHGVVDVTDPSIKDYINIYNWITKHSGNHPGDRPRWWMLNREEHMERSRELLERLGIRND
jgi:hypothetical protein